jgi:hypothetical protein
MRKRPDHQAKITFSTGYQPGCCPEHPCLKLTASADQPASRFLRRVSERCLELAKACEGNEVNAPAAECGS